MALYYLDSSALVKRYVPERGSAWVEEFCDKNDVAISLITVVEMASALGRRAKEGNLTEDQRDQIYRQFVDDEPRYQLLGLTEQISQRVASLLLTSPEGLSLRTLDAIHLASAQLLLRDSGQVEASGIVTSDRALLRAAPWAGLGVDNPEEGSQVR
jgi:predicted nucleic acid-binding protein